METNAKAKFIRISPRKVRLVVDTVRGLKIEEALDKLKLINKAATKPVSKLINSAAANAEHNFELEKDNLYIKEIRVDEGPTLKRWMPRAHGRATPIRKRSSHINLILAEIKDSGLRKGRKPETGEVVKLGEKPKIQKDEKPAQSASRIEAGKAKKEGDKKPKEKKEIGEKVEKPKDGKAPVEDVFDKSGQIHDPRREGRRGHARTEGGQKGFINKIFRRKSG